MTRENPIDFRRISNEVSKHLHTLQILKCLTMHWDHLLVPILTSKLDSLTLREWGTSLMGHESPSLKQLLDFIAHRCEVLEITRASTSAKKVEAKSQPILSGHRRVRLPLNLNVISVKENTSFIIAKILWHFQYHKGSWKFAVANFASIACASLRMHQVNAFPVNARSARQNTIRYFIYPLPRNHRLAIPIRKLHLRQLLLPPSYRIML